LRAAARFLALAFVAVLSTAATIDIAAGQSPSFGLDLPLTSADGTAGAVIELASVPVPSELVGQTCNATFESENNGSIREGSDLILSSGASSLELVNVERSTPLVLTTSGPLTLATALAVSVRLGPEGEFSGGGAASTVICAEPPTTTTTTIPPPPPPPDVCQYTVSPVRLPPSGGVVTVAGTAPFGSVVRIFAGGIFQASVQASPTDGSFSVTFFLSRTSEIGVSVDDHPATGCGIDAVRQAAVPGGTAVGPGLPRTGGSSTRATLIVGLALVLVGGGLVLAVRRDDDQADAS
jgi:LPXTG-motif cell wall-anchored protein